MKSKPSLASSRGHNLHVHCSSTIITKDSRIHNKITKNAIPDKHVQISPNDKCNRLTKVVDCRDSCDGAVTQISDVVLLSSDHKAIDMGVHQENPPFVFETFFSHNFDDDDVDKKVMIETNEGERSEVVDDESSDMPHLVTDDSDESSYSTHELQSCSVSDFIISDLTIPTFSFNDSMGFSDLICSSSPDYDHISSELTFDMEEGYMMLPFPEEKIDKNATNPHNDDFVMNMDDSYLCVAIHELRSLDQQTGISFQPSGFEELDYFDSHLFLKVPEAETVPPLCPLKSQKETQNKRVTLVLDLDETLVHSTLNHCKDADFSFVVFFNMKENTVYVRKRPYLHEFLDRVSQMFEIIVFTASQSVYAEKLLDMLDPDKKFTYNRVFRDSCIMSEGTYTKDLTVLGIDLAKVAIVDNSPQVFRLQVNNGIPIKSWFDDPSDNALPSLLPFLETLVDAEDVRPIIAKKFGNKEK